MRISFDEQTAHSSRTGKASATTTASSAYESLLLRFLADDDDSQRNRAAAAAWMLLLEGEDARPRLFCWCFWALRSLLWSRFRAPILLRDWIIVMV